MLSSCSSYLNTFHNLNSHNPTAAMGTCTSCCEACAFCEYVDVPDKVLWQELDRKKIRVWKIRRLLDQNNASPNATQRNMRGQRDNVLHCAVRLGHFEIVDDIVTAGATVELPSDLYDTTPIQHARSTQSSFAIINRLQSSQA